METDETGLRAEIRDLNFDKLTYLHYDFLDIVIDKIGQERVDETKEGLGYFGWNHMNRVHFCLSGKIE